MSYSESDDVEQRIYEALAKELEAWHAEKEYRDKSWLKRRMIIVLEDLLDNIKKDLQKQVEVLSL